jgi:hypothetical protein
MKYNGTSKPLQPVEQEKAKKGATFAHNNINHDSDI